MAAALIAIGPNACEALAAAAEQPMRREDRLVAIFVVTSRAREYLTSALGHANQERLWSQEGLRIPDLGSTDH